MSLNQNIFKSIFVIQFIFKFNFTHCFIQQPVVLQIEHKYQNSNTILLLKHQVN